MKLKLNTVEDTARPPRAAAAPSPSIRPTKAVSTAPKRGSSKSDATAGRASAQIRASRFEDGSSVFGVEDDDDASTSSASTPSDVPEGGARPPASGSSHPSCLDTVTDTSRRIPTPRPNLRASRASATDSGSRRARRVARTRRRATRRDEDQGASVPPSAERRPGAHVRADPRDATKRDAETTDIAPRRGAGVVCRGCPIISPIFLPRRRL